MLISDKSDMSKKYVNNVFFLILWKQKKIFEKDLAKRIRIFKKSLWVQIMLNFDKTIFLL